MWCGSHRACLRECGGRAEELASGRGGDAFTGHHPPRHTSALPKSSAAAMPPLLFYLARTHASPVPEMTWALSSPSGPFRPLQAPSRRDDRGPVSRDAGDAGPGWIAVLPVIGREDKRSRGWPISAALAHVEPTRASPQPNLIPGRPSKSKWSRWQRSAAQRRAARVAVTKPRSAPSPRSHSSPVAGPGLAWHCPRPPSSISIRSDSHRHRLLHGWARHASNACR